MGLDTESRMWFNGGMEATTTHKTTKTDDGYEYRGVEIRRGGTRHHNMVNDRGLHYSTGTYESGNWRVTLRTPSRKLDNGRWTRGYTDTFSYRTLADAKAAIDRDLDR